MPRESTVRAELPTGTVTFLFTDVEGSTKLLNAHPEAYRAAIRRHHTLLREAVEQHDGTVFETVGDAVYAAFAQATDAVVAAVDGQRALLEESWGEGGPIRVRMAVHTGEVERQGDHYFGAPLYRCNRLMGTAHGGQIVLSGATADLVRDAITRAADGSQNGIALRDLGEHRLKDLARPERIFQVMHAALPAAFPPLRTLESVSNNLPAQATPFIGREQEVLDARERLLRSDVRLLVLSGPGGVGKTRLSLQVAAEVAESFPAGVYFVPLAPITDPDLVPSAVAQVLGVRAAEGRPVRDALREYLRERPMLLVLDNFEHLLGQTVPAAPAEHDGAPFGAAPFVAELLAGCPTLKLLVTSRAVLHLYGEHELPVPPLALPDRAHHWPAQALTRYEAIRLFVERAQAAQPSFSLDDANAHTVADICRRLDGLPLAIELAAARVRLLPPPAMLARLDHRLPLLTGGARDLPARQQTLRNAIAWSYDLLSPKEQALFRRLAVFAGGSSLAAAEALFDPGNDALDGIESLLDKSLVQQTSDSNGEPRFSMLETIREFGVERLAAAGEEAAMRNRHAAYYVDLAQQAESELRGPAQAEWLRRLDHEHDNVRAALDWLAGPGATELGGQAEQGLRLVAAFWRFWDVRGFLSEGREQIARFLGAPLPAPTSPRYVSAQRALRASALYGAGALAFEQDDYAAAEAAYQESLAIARDIGDLRGEAMALTALGQLACFQSDFKSAMRLGNEALALHRQVQDVKETAHALNTLWSTHILQGDWEPAHAFAEEALALHRRAGNQRGIGWSLFQLACWTHWHGDYDQALSLYEQSLAIRRELQDFPGIAYTVENMGRLMLDRSDPEAARPLFREGLEIWQRLGDSWGLARALEGLAGMAAALGHAQRALTLAGAAAHVREIIGAPLSDEWQAIVERHLAPARRALSETAAREAEQAGRTMARSEAIAYALSDRDTESGELVGSSRPGANGVLVPLSRREQEVAALVAQGLTNRQIAERLIITEGTAANHIAHILNKLNVDSRVQVAAWAVQHGLVTAGR